MFHTNEVGGDAEKTEALMRKKSYHIRFVVVQRKNAGQNQKYIIHTPDCDKNPEMIMVRCATESKKEYDS